MKSFRVDLIEMESRLTRRQPFAFSRVGDGELAILNGERRSRAEFRFNPVDRGDLFLRDRLLESFRYRSESYYVGISCPRCVGEERFQWAKRMCIQPEARLTWTTLFVNSNYRYFSQHVVPLFMITSISVILRRVCGTCRFP
jgi:hypothetical protein